MSVDFMTDAYACLSKLKFVKTRHDNFFFTLFNGLYEEIDLWGMKAAKPYIPSDDC
jgi:hypothetical protein